MSDPSLSEALAEAYASAPAARPLIQTLSLYYAGIESAGEPSEIYMFSGFEGDRRTPDGIPVKKFRLEPAARFFPASVVEFIAVPFDVGLPPVESAPTAKAVLTLDGVGREVSDALLKAIDVGAQLEFTYRAYLSGLELDGPQNDPPLTFWLQSVSVTATQVRGEITVANIGTKRFPGELYRSSNFPALR